MIRLSNCQIILFQCTIGNLPAQVSCSPFLSFRKSPDLPPADQTMNDPQIKEFPAIQRCFSQINNFLTALSRSIWPNLALCTAIPAGLFITIISQSSPYYAFFEISHSELGHIHLLPFNQARILHKLPFDSNIIIYKEVQKQATAISVFRYNGCP